MSDKAPHDELKLTREISEIVDRMRGTMPQGRFLVTLLKMVESGHVSRPPPNGPEGSMLPESPPGEGDGGQGNPGVFSDLEDTPRDPRPPVS